MMPSLDRDAQLDELARSRAQIEAWTGRPVWSFSYPNGAITGLDESVVTDAGYSSAVAVGDRPVRSDAPVLALPRFDVGRFDASWLGFVLTGALDRARRLRR